jgi:hypothetical protein
MDERMEDVEAAGHDDSDVRGERVDVFLALCGRLLCGRLLCGRLLCGRLLCGRLLCGRFLSVVGCSLFYSLVCFESVDMEGSGVVKNLCRDMSL